MYAPKYWGIASPETNTGLHRECSTADGIAEMARLTGLGYCFVRMRTVCRAMRGVGPARAILPGGGLFQALAGQLF